MKKTMRLLGSALLVLSLLFTCCSAFAEGPAVVEPGSFASAEIGPITFDTPEPATFDIEPMAPMEIGPITFDTPEPGALDAGGFAPAEAPAGTFDPELVGPWLLNDHADKETIDLELLDALRSLSFFLPGGYVGFEEFWAFMDIYSADMPRIEAANGETNLGEELIKWMSFVYSSLRTLPSVNQDMLDESEAELSKIRDLKISYEVKDFSMADSSYAFLEQYKEAHDMDYKDALILHITGSYQADPLTTLPIDSIYRFVRDYTDDAWIKACLCGEWTDSNGNAWSIHYKMNDNGGYDLSGSLTDSSGAVHEAQAIFVYADVGGFVQPYLKDGSNELTFFFMDFTSPQYSLVAVDENQLTLSSDKGDLVMTRN